jgi:hypothetical protein
MKPETGNPKPVIPEIHPVFADELSGIPIPTNAFVK